MKNKYLLLMMLLCFACLGAARAEVVTIGSGSGTIQYLPTYATFNYSLTQQIYTAAEIGRAGTITSIAFKNTGSVKTRVLEIYLVHTNKTSFSSTTDWITVNNSDLVFFGNVTFTAGEWTTILFNTPFEYNGTSNLAVIVDDETGSWQSGMTCAAFDATGMGLRVYSDNTDFNPLSPPTSYASDEYAAITNMKNQIKLDFPTCLPPANAHIQGGSLTYNGVTLAWDNDDAGPVFQLFLQESAYFNPENMPWCQPWQFGGSATWDNLDPDTDYTIGLRRYCSEDDQSDPVLMTIHTPSACPLITFVTVNVLNSWQVSLSWDAPESNYDTRAEYKLSTETEWSLWADHIGGGGVFPGESNSTYDFRVKQYCTNGYDSDWAYTSFTTFAEVPFTESFDATSIPDHWHIYSGLLNDVMAGTAQLSPITGYWGFGPRNGVFDNHAYLNIYNSNRRHWLVMPQVTMENNCQLSFELALTKYTPSNTPTAVDPTQQADDRFVVLASTDGGSTWTILREWNNTGSPYVYNNILPTGEDVVIDLSAYQEDTNLMIAFYGESTVNGNGDNNLHIDNVSIDYIPACQKPTNFHVSSIAERSVVLSWDAPEGQNHWEVGYKTDNDSYYYCFTEPTENPYLFSGHPDRPLQPETHYTVMVRALCNGFNETSDWSKEIDFTTLEPCALPTNVTILETRPHGFTASFTPGTPTQTPNWFYFYSTDPDAIISWDTWIDSTTFVVDRPSGNYAIEPETTYYLWILYFCEEENTLVWGDPVTFTTPEACPAPTNLTITNVTPHGVEATFTPGGDWQTQWGYYYTTTNVPPPYFNSITIVPSAIYPEWLHALQPNTHYYLWVGIECEEGGTSTYVWGEPAEFTTPYACPTKVLVEDVEIDDVQPHEVSLDWGDSPATADQWQVCYSYYDIIPPESSMSENSVIVDEPYATIDDLFPDLDYHFWIRALCDYLDGTPEWGEWSNMITVHTEVSCFPPINVTVSNITSTTATISWDPNPNTTVPVQYYEVNIESDDWGDVYVTTVSGTSVDLDFDGWVDEGEDIPCTVYVHAYCGQVEGMSEASEFVGFILTDKESLTVNDGTNTNTYVPIHGVWVDQYTKSQFIIPADDIVDMQYSEISWMTFYAENEYINWGNAKFDVYMMELPYCQTEFEGATPTFYDWDDMDAVYSHGSLSIVNGLMVVELDEPYLYTDGSLLIGFKQTVKGSYKSCIWHGVSQTGNTAIGGYETSKDISFQKFLPKTTFVYEPKPNLAPTCRRPSQFTAEVSGSQYVTFNWVPGSEDQTKWQIAFGLPEVFDINDASTWTNLLTLYTYPSTNANPDLYTPETTYVACIRARCDNSNSFSSWSCPITFTMGEVCPSPTNVTITDITTTEATVNWVSQNDIWISMYKTVSQNVYGFETNTLEGWTSEGNATWEVGTGDDNSYVPVGAHSGNYNALITHIDDNYETWLISPVMSFTGMPTAFLDFWYINRNWSGDVDELEVYWRVDGGEWNREWQTTEAHETWTSQRIEISYLANFDNFQIAFKMTDHYGYGVGLDDIDISAQLYAGTYNAYYPDQSLTLTNLDPNTKYMFYINTNCGGTYGHAVWTSFTTEEETNATQTIDLVEGWNWISTYIAADDPMATLQMLETALGENATQIKSADSYTDYYEGYGWYGPLDETGGMNNQEMYMIMANGDCSVTLQGPAVDPTTVVITINPGWNWIGFPFDHDMTPDEAFANFTPTDLDVIKGGEDFWTYYEGFGWYSETAEYMVPGQGYMYNSYSGTSQTLVFPSGAKAKRTLPTDGKPMKRPTEAIPTDINRPTQK